MFGCLGAAFAVARGGVCPWVLEFESLQFDLLEFIGEYRFDVTVWFDDIERGGVGGRVYVTE